MRAATPSAKANAANLSDDGVIASGGRGSWSGDSIKAGPLGHFPVSVVFLSLCDQILTPFGISMLALLAAQNQLIAF